MDIALILTIFCIVMASLTVHEWAHAWTADRLGDPTARLLGRVSFNPIVHIDPIGTIVLPLIAAFSTGFVFGWAKPVPVNISRLRNPKRDFMIVAAAGPASNLIMAAVAAMIFRAAGGVPAADNLAMQILARFVMTNVGLAVFNMLPVPPLDGGNVLSGLLPDSFAPVINGLRQYGFIILLGLIVTGALDVVVRPVSLMLQKFLLL